MRYVLILSLMVLAAGCKSQQVAQGPAQGHVYPGRSTVFGSPRSADAPWFASRNDVRPTVAAGVQSPIVQESASRTYDRTHSYGGQVHDYYYRTRIDVRYRSTTQ